MTSVYGDPYNRHNDFKNIQFDIGPCTFNCKNVTKEVRDAEFNKLEFVFVYNNERNDLTAPDNKLVVKETIVKSFKINPKNGP